MTIRIGDKLVGDITTVREGDAAHSHPRTLTGVVIYVHPAGRHIVARMADGYRETYLIRAGQLIGAEIAHHTKHARRR